MTDQNLTPEAVERFEPPRSSDWKTLPMRIDVTGRYVRASDYDALAQQNAALKAEVERLMADPLYIIGVNHGWDEAVENGAAHPAARPMQSMLADAERDMRQRAADEARSCCHEGDYVANAILALPLKHADREGGV